MIRKAKDEDINELVKLLQEFSREVPVHCASSAFSPRVVANRLKKGIALGLCFVAMESEESDPIGVILGGVQQNVWSDKTYEITLLAQYVKPHYRKKIVGGRMFKEYLKQCDKLMEKYPRIAIAYAMTQPKGTNLKMEKHGFTLMQTIYKKE